MKDIGKKLSLVFCLILLTIIINFSGSGESINTSISRLKKYENDNIRRVFLLKENNTYSTLIQKIANRGYKSNIEMYVTIDFTGNSIEDFIITRHNESEDYGKYIEEQWFQERFIGKNACKELVLVKMAAEKPEEIVGVTGATISSEAIVEGVNKAFHNFIKIKGGVVNEKNHK